jgi:hypothetical protein
MNKVNGAYVGANVSHMLGQGRAEELSGDELFRSRMESQCQQIRQYRVKVLEETGRLLSPDQAALQWIERFAATFDCQICD